MWLIDDFYFRVPNFDDDFTSLLRERGCIGYVVVVNRKRLGDC